MFINITNLVNVATNVTGSTTAEQTAMTNLQSLISSNRGYTVLGSGATLPVADLSNFGHMYYNTDSGNVVISNGKNWIDVSTVSWVEPFYFGGNLYGYVAGGYLSPGTTNAVERFSFTTDGNAISEPYNISQATYNLAGVSDQRNQKGYVLGSFTDVIDFANQTISALSPSTPHTTQGNTGIGAETHGYFYADAALKKFDFANNTTVSIVPSLTNVGSYSTTCMDAQGNKGFWITLDKIDEVNFSSEASTTASPSPTPNGYTNQASSASSTTHGYQHGGIISSIVDDIKKFPFASTQFLSQVGNLTAIARLSTGQSSTVNGYISGSADDVSNTIDKYPFASDNDATNVGSLTVAKGQTTPLFN